MNVRCSLAILSFTAVLAFAQTDGITVTVGKTLELPAEEATYQIGVVADADVTLDKVRQIAQHR